MIANLALAGVLVGLTVAIHFGALLALMWALRASGHRLRAHEGAVRQGIAILVVVLGLVAIHTAEVWAYAVAYLALGALPDLETALYFSTTSFTTLGYGDVVLAREWRIVGAIEGANGLLLFGWSTAFLVSITGRMRLLEHDWLERGPGSPQAIPSG
ncbi:MAG: potassium channel family protein [Alphaproteobacteria bacterium]|nr:potassium channel family protein [Alphaproteobacteria bacterium]